MEWLKLQWEWIKSFASEPPDANGFVKGSQKRFLSFWVVIAFIVAWFKKMLEMKPADPIPDIPPTWAVLILAILGLGIYANQISSKNKIDEIKIDNSEKNKSEKAIRGIVKLDERIKKIEEKL